MNRPLIPACSIADPNTLCIWANAAKHKAESHATVKIYVPEKKNGAAFLICPGGGYGRLVMDGEGHAVAEWLNSHGISGFVLQYQLPSGNPLVPLGDAQRAMRVIRSKALEWGINPNRIGVMGFSAGGHLASTLGTHFDNGDSNASDPVERESCRPDFMVLVYPVISMGDQTHPGTRRNLLGKNPSEKMVMSFSNEKQVTGKTPPTFLAHAVNDELVSPENSQMFYEALCAQGVPAKYLSLPSGGHGLDLYKGPMWKRWQQESLKWLIAQKLITPAS